MYWLGAYWIHPTRQMAPKRWSPKRYPNIVSKAGCSVRAQHLPMHIFSSNFRARYSIPPRRSRSSCERPKNCELRPTVTRDDSVGRSDFAKEPPRELLGPRLRLLFSDDPMTNMELATRSRDKAFGLLMLQVSPSRSDRNRSCWMSSSSGEVRIVKMKYCWNMLTIIP